jgi:hypothetical protein
VIHNGAVTGWEIVTYGKHHRSPEGSGRFRQRR